MLCATQKNDMIVVNYNQFIFYFALKFLITYRTITISFENVNIHNNYSLILDLIV